MLVTMALTVSSWSSKNMTRTSLITVKIVAVSSSESLVNVNDSAFRHIS